MKVNYTSSITGKRTTARIDEHLWNVFQKVIRMCGVKAGDDRTNAEHWAVKLDKEYRTFGKNEAPTFSAYIAKRLEEEITLDLSVLEDSQERLQLA